METVATAAGAEASPSGAPLPEDLDRLLAAYSQGELSRKMLEQATGLWFGEILAELARRGLALPRVDSSVRFNQAQQRLYEQVFG
jgi:hypothetical protein